MLGMNIVITGLVAGLGIGCSITGTLFIFVPSITRFGFTFFLSWGLSSLFVAFKEYQITTTRSRR